MRLLHFLSFLALPATIFADANAVLADINSISDLLTTLSGSVEGVVPGIPGLPYALRVQADAVNVDSVITTGIQHANASGPFGSGSLQIGLSLISLESQISSALGDIGEKNATFGDLGIVVLSSLAQLKRDTNLFSDQIVPKLGALEAGIAPGVVQSINDSFDAAIAAYQGNGQCFLPYLTILSL